MFLFGLLLPLQSAGAGVATMGGLTHGGLAREYRVYTPDNAEARPAAVLVFHGGGGSIEGVVRSTGFDATADAHGFLAVYPAGVTGPTGKMGTWNGGGCCGRAARDKVDDVGFVAALIHRLVAEHGVDPARVYATGHSNGAMMAYRLACELSEKVAAVAPHGSQPVVEACAPFRAVPVLHAHGTADPCARYEGGQCGGCMQEFLDVMGLDLPQERWDCSPVPEAVAAVAARNGCTEPPREVLRLGALVCEAWGGCRAATEFCRTEGGGHPWPGGPGPEFCARRPKGRLCERYRAVVGPLVEVPLNEVIWDFFNRHRLPAAR